MVRIRTPATLLPDHLTYIGTIVQTRFPCRAIRSCRALSPQPCVTGAGDYLHNAELQKLDSRHKPYPSNIPGLTIPHHTIPRGTGPGSGPAAQPLIESSESDRLGRSRLIETKRGSTVLTAAVRRTPNTAKG